MKRTSSHNAGILCQKEWGWPVAITHDRGTSMFKGTSGRQWRKHCHYDKFPVYSWKNLAGHSCWQNAGLRWTLGLILQGSSCVNSHSCVSIFCCIMCIATDGEKLL